MCVSAGKSVGEIAWRRWEGIGSRGVKILIILILLKPHILVFNMQLTIWESDIAFNLWNNRKKRNITISILSGAGQGHRGNTNKYKL